MIQQDEFGIHCQGSGEMGSGVTSQDFIGSEKEQEAGDGNVRFCMEVDITVSYSYSFSVTDNYTPP